MYAAVFVRLRRKEGGRANALGGRSEPSSSRRCSVNHFQSLVRSEEDWAKRIYDRRKAEKNGGLGFERV